MKDAACDPIGPEMDHDFEDSETQAGMTAAESCGKALLRYTQHSAVLCHAVLRSAVSCSAGALQCNAVQRSAGAMHAEQCSAMQHHICAMHVYGSIADVRRQHCTSELHICIAHVAYSIKVSG